MTDVVNRLRVNMHAYGICQEAADEIERLRAEHEVTAANLHAWMRLKADAEARLAEAVEVLLDVNDAAQIDVLMEGPRLQGWRRSELDRLWPKLRAFLAKLGQPHETV